MTSIPDVHARGWRVTVRLAGPCGSRRVASVGVNRSEDNGASGLSAAAGFRCFRMLRGRLADPASAPPRDVPPVRDVAQYLG